LRINALLAAIHKRKREDAIWLLCSLLELNRSGLLFNGDIELDPKFLRRWQKLWARRVAGEPLQYIAGSAPFYGREFLVSPQVLIPRPETESLVELATSLLAGQPEASVVDIGTGSGAIAITLKLEHPAWRVVGTDISAPALAVARKNAAKLGAQVNFQKRNLFDSTLAKQAFDLVVSNPPYLEFKRDHIAKDVQRWEPRMALEPTASLRVGALKDRAAWAGERILSGCAGARVAHTALELSPRVATILERRWRRHPRVQRLWRAPDLAGRKRFLLVTWQHA
jgi:release factor glutamine methyltransferase